MKLAVVLDGVKGYYDLEPIRSLIELEADEVILASNPRTGVLCMCQVVHNERNRALLQVIKHEPTDIFFKVSHANMKGRLFRILG